ncbi:MAG: gamma-glutamyltransferase, partial [Paracoccus sp. (in: a-proteobacteria)]
MTRTGLGLVLLLGSVAMAGAQQAVDAVAPEGASGTAVSVQGFGDLGQAARDSLSAKAEGRAVTGQDWMVTAAHPLAVEAGARVLEAGGSAADAM